MAEEKLRVEEAALRSKVGVLMVVVPVVAPIVRLVAAPAKLRVVAVALKTSKLADPVMTEVRKDGDVAKTNEPVPVGSVTEERRLLEEIVVVALLESSVASRRLAVSPDKVKPEKVGEEEVAMSWGADKMMEPSA